MNAPLLWIGVPLVVSVILFILRDRPGLVLVLAVITNLVLASIAFLLPSGESFNLGGIQVSISNSFIILGRRFLLESGDRPFLGMVFAFGAFWYAGGKIAGVNRYFAPLGLMVMAFLVAALAVEPFLYAALLVETAVLFCIPIFSPPHTTVKTGVLRFLVFQTMAMPFILIAGWAAGAVDLNPADEHLLHQAVILLALGFAFWLAVFPFHNWMPLLFSQVNPFIVGFFVLLLNTVVFILCLDFLNAFAWLREFDLLYSALRLVGIIMIVSGGIWAFFQQELARLLAYAIIVENGFSLLALSLNSRTGLEIFVSLFPARFLCVALFSLSLAVLSEKVPLTVQGTKGIIFKYPMASLGLLTGLMGISGLPLLAIFPMRLYLLENLSQLSMPSVVWVLIGMICLVASGLRLLASFVSSEEKKWQFQETGGQAFFLAGGMLLNLLIGIFPRWLLPGIQKLLEVFNQLQ